ncbi:MAG: T9SS type A sorting domain-containing protein [Saprospiraceae bacterium]|nr:T9SS type A sorting domain-containing protein [Saprospiraceae bacterium]
MKRLTFFLTLYFWVLASVARGQSTDPFINEVNYKATNPAQRGAEVAGPAGTDMTGWSIVSYQPNGTVASTRPINSGSIPDLQNGHGSIWYDVEQSSQPSGGGGGGMALVKPDGTVTQFISYGTNLIFSVIITATNGPASGMTSQHIGTQLLSGSSLQLTGIGLEYLDFIWALPGGSTPGQVNTLQIFGLLGNLLNSTIGSLFAQAAAEKPATETFLMPFGKVQQEVGFDLQVYPNPVSDYLQVNFGEDLPETATLSIISSNGRLVKSTTTAAQTKQVELDLKNLPAGIYAIRLTTAKGQVTKIIMKQ